MLYLCDSRASCFIWPAGFHLAVVFRMSELFIIVYVLFWINKDNSNDDDDDDDDVALQQFQKVYLVTSDYCLTQLNVENSHWNDTYVCVCVCVCVQDVIAMVMQPAATLTLRSTRRQVGSAVVCVTTVSTTRWVTTARSASRSSTTTQTDPSPTHMSAEVSFVDSNTNTNTWTAFMVLSSWQSHCKSSPGSSDECRTVPSGCRSSDEAIQLGLWMCQ